MSARQAKHRLVVNPPWWAVFDVQKTQLDLVCMEILRLYTQPKAVYVELGAPAAAAPMAALGVMQL